MEYFSRKPDLISRIYAKLILVRDTSVHNDDRVDFRDLIKRGQQSAVINADG